MDQRMDLRTPKEKSKDRTRKSIYAILLLTLALVLSSCAHSGAVFHGEMNDLSEDVTERAFDGAENTGGLVIGNLINKAIKGGKKIYVDNSGCVAVKITRFDGGKINGVKSVIVPPEKGGELIVKLDVLSDRRDGLVLQAERYGDIPPGCRRIGRDTEGFRADYEPEGWRISLR